MVNISNEIIDGIKIYDANVYENISDSFKDAINLNPHFERKIQEIYLRTLGNYARTTLSAYHLKYIEMFNYLAGVYSEEDDEFMDFADSLITIIDSYFKELDSNLNIKSQNDLDELKYILQISSILMEEVLEENNIELAYETFFQIERRIKKYDLYKKSVHILDNGGNFDIKITLRENSIATLKLNESNVGGKSYEL